MVDNPRQRLPGLHDRPGNTMADILGRMSEGVLGLHPRDAARFANKVAPPLEFTGIQDLHDVMTGIMEGDTSLAIFGAAGLTPLGRIQKALKMASNGRYAPVMLINKNSEELSRSGNNQRTIQIGLIDREQGDSIVATMEGTIHSFAEQGAKDSSEMMKVHRFFPISDYDAQRLETLKLPAMEPSLVESSTHSGGRLPAGTRAVVSIRDLFRRELPSVQKVESYRTSGAGAVGDFYNNKFDVSKSVFTQPEFNIYEDAVAAMSPKQLQELSIAQLHTLGSSSFVDIDALPSAQVGIIRAGMRMYESSGFPKIMGRTLRQFQPIGPQLPEGKSLTHFAQSDTGRQPFEDALVRSRSRGTLRRSTIPSGGYPQTSEGQQQRAMQVFERTVSGRPLEGLPELSDQDQEMIDIIATFARMPTQFQRNARRVRDLYVVDHMATSVGQRFMLNIPRPMRRRFTREALESLATHADRLGNQIGSEGIRTGVIGSRVNFHRALLNRIREMDQAEDLGQGGGRALRNQR